MTTNQLGDTICGGEGYSDTSSILVPVLLYYDTSTTNLVWTKYMPSSLPAISFSAFNFADNSIIFGTNSPIYIFQSDATGTITYSVQINSLAAAGINTQQVAGDAQNIYLALTDTLASPCTYILALKYTASPTGVWGKSYCASYQQPNIPLDIFSYGGLTLIVKGGVLFDTTYDAVNKYIYFMVYQQSGTLQDTIINLLPSAYNSLYMQHFYYQSSLTLLSGCLADGSSQMFGLFSVNYANVITATGSQGGLQFYTNSTAAAITCIGVHIDSAGTSYLGLKVVDTTPFTYTFLYSFDSYAGSTTSLLGLVLVTYFLPFFPNNFSMIDLTKIHFSGYLKMSLIFPFNCGFMTQISTSCATGDITKQPFQTAAVLTMDISNTISTIYQPTTPVVIPSESTYALSFTDPTTSPVITPLSINDLAITRVKFKYKYRCGQPESLIPTPPSAGTSLTCNSGTTCQLDMGVFTNDEGCTDILWIVFFVIDGVATIFNGQSYAPFPISATSVPAIAVGTTIDYTIDISTLSSNIGIHTIQVFTIFDLIWVQFNTIYTISLTLAPNCNSFVVSLVATTPSPYTATYTVSDPLTHLTFDYFQVVPIPTCTSPSISYTYTTVPAPTYSTFDVTNKNVDILTTSNGDVTAPGTVQLDITGTITNGDASTSQVTLSIILTINPDCNQFILSLLTRAQTSFDYTIGDPTLTMVWLGAFSVNTITGCTTPTIAYTLKIDGVVAPPLPGYMILYDDTTTFSIDISTALASDIGTYTITIEASIPTVPIQIQQYNFNLVISPVCPNSDIIITAPPSYDIFYILGSPSLILTFDYFTASLVSPCTTPIITYQFIFNSTLNPPIPEYISQVDASNKRISIETADSTLLGGPYPIEIDATIVNIDTSILTKTLILYLYIIRSALTTNKAPFFTKQLQNQILYANPIKDSSTPKSKDSSLVYQLPEYKDLEKDNVTLTVFLGIAGIFTQFNAKGNYFEFNLNIDQRFFSLTFKIGLVLSDNNTFPQQQIYDFNVTVVAQDQKSGKEESAQQKEEKLIKENIVKDSNLTANISRIYPNGTVQVKFSQFMFDPGNYSNITSNHMLLYIVNEFQNQAFMKFQDQIDIIDYSFGGLIDTNFSWEVICYYQDLIYIQLNFSDPLSISSLQVTYI